MTALSEPAQVGLAHDYLLVRRGAERTFEAIAELWPGAPVYTTLYSAAGTDEAFAGHPIHTSPLQRLGLEQATFRRWLPVFPWATSRLDLTRHDLVLSSSSAFAHGVRVDPAAVHVCYCHSPFRYVWHERETALREVPSVARPALRGVLGAIRRWDVRASERVTSYVANARITQDRIAEFYGVESEIVHPPVDVERFAAAPPEDYLLTVGEIVAHKRIEVALEGARRAGRRVQVVGTGPELERLRVRYRGTAEFLGRVPDDQLPELYAKAAAVLVPNVEEFGIVAVEAQAAGRPVVATGKGGAVETVLDGTTGVLAPNGSIDEFAEILAHTDFHRFDSARIAEHAQRFSRPRFQSELRDAALRAWRTHPR